MHSKCYLEYTKIYDDDVDDDENDDVVGEVFGSSREYFTTEGSLKSPKF